MAQFLNVRSSNRGKISVGGNDQQEPLRKWNLTYARKDREDVVKQRASGKAVIVRR